MSAPTSIAHYRIVSKLGEGDIGAVYANMHSEGIWYKPPGSLGGEVGMCQRVGRMGPNKR